MPNLKLKSSDGKIFHVDVEIAKVSGTIKTMLDRLGMDDEVVPLLKVKATVLQKVIEWATHHKDDPPPTDDHYYERRVKRTDDFSRWDADFLNVGQAMLHELMLAANYLDIKGLLDITCKAVASIVEFKSVEEIRSALNIKNDFSPSEEAKIKEENDWCEE